MVNSAKTDVIKKLTERIPDGTDAIIISSVPNRFYFTGFPSSAGTLFIMKDKSYFIIDSRYIEAAQKQISNCEVILEDNLQNQLRDLICKYHIHTVGIEAGYLSILEAQQFEQMVNPAQLIYDSRINEEILSLRKIKSGYEIECLAKAQQITDMAFEYILDYIKPGASELELMIRLGSYMSQHGSERRSFDFIFTSGTKTSLPHGGGELRNIQDGDFVMMDMGSCIGGYSSDMTRTVAVGDITDEQRRVYKTVLEAQEMALSEIKPGAVCREIDAIARNYIDNSGYKGCFGHGLGHSLGIEIHENPRFNKVCEEKLKPGMIMTVEPGIYLPGKFGVRIEDMIVITENCFENLTKSPKKLIIL